MDEEGWIIYLWGRKNDLVLSCNWIAFTNLSLEWQVEYE